MRFYFIRRAELDVHTPAIRKAAGCFLITEPLVGVPQPAVVFGSGFLSIPGRVPPAPEVLDPLVTLVVRLLAR